MRRAFFKKLKTGKQIVFLQPFFGMSRNVPPKEMAARNRTTFFSFCVCGLFALYSTDQSHNGKVQVT